MLELDREKLNLPLAGHAGIGAQPERQSRVDAATAPQNASESAASLCEQTQTNVLIRDAEDSDADGLAQIVGAIMGEFPGCIFDLEADFPELKQPRSSFKKDGGRFWVAERRPATASGLGKAAGKKVPGEIVGCFGFLPAEDPRGIELVRVYLRPELRGTGLAPKMFKIVQAVARQRSAAFIELWTDRRFTAAQRFYEKLGFTKLPDERLLNDRSHSSEYHYLLNLR